MNKGKMTMDGKNSSCGGGFYDDEDEEEYSSKGKKSGKAKGMEEELHGEIGRESFRSFMKSIGASVKDEDKAMKHLARFVSHYKGVDDSDESDDWGEEDYGSNSALTKGGSQKVKEERKKMSTYSANAYDDDDEDYMQDRVEQNGQYYTASKKGASKRMG